MTGTISLSIELELGWGTSLVETKRDLKKFSDLERSRETETLERLLRACDENDVPIGFDVVGHLFLETCDGHESPHHPGWFNMDPETGVREDALFYAPDLIEMIRNAEIDHEMGTHTFSHVPCDDVSHETLEWEIRAAGDLHDRHGFGRPTFLVPPRHRCPPAEVLRENGIRTLRFPTPDYRGPDSTARKFVWHFTKEPLNKGPTYEDGLTVIPCQPGASLAAFYLQKGDADPHPAFRAIPRRIRQRAHRRYLGRAVEIAEAGGDVHLWSHLYDISNDAQWPLVHEFIHQVGDATRNSDVDVLVPSAL